MKIITFIGRKIRYQRVATATSTSVVYYMTHPSQSVKLRA